MWGSNLADPQKCVPRRPGQAGIGFMFWSVDDVAPKRSTKPKLSGSDLSSPNLQFQLRGRLPDRTVDGSESGSQTSVFIEMPCETPRLLLTQPRGQASVLGKLCGSWVLPARGPGSSAFFLARALSPSLERLVKQTTWLSCDRVFISREVNSPCFPCLRGLTAGRLEEDGQETVSGSVELCTKARCRLAQRLAHVGWQSEKMLLGVREGDQEQSRGMFRKRRGQQGLWLQPSLGSGTDRPKDSCWTGSTKGAAGHQLLPPLSP